MRATGEVPPLPTLAAAALPLLPFCPTLGVLPKVSPLLLEAAWITGAVLSGAELAPLPLRAAAAAFLSLLCCLRASMVPCSIAAVVLR
jgi:hypothetical protein